MPSEVSKPIPQLPEISRHQPAKLLPVPKGVCRAWMNRFPDEVERSCAGFGDTPKPPQIGHLTMIGEPLILPTKHGVSP